MLTLLLIVFLVAALLSLPSWPYSRGWGYYPTGGFGVALVLVLLVLYFGPRG
jgi:Protein of unknown function (DUF3309)